MDASGGAGAQDEVYRLRETRTVPADGPCPGWFAYLLGPGWQGTSKVLTAAAKLVADYPKSEGLKLQRLHSLHSRDMVGVPFSTKAEAEAFVAYAKALMPKEHPTAFCFTAQTAETVKP